MNKFQLFLLNEIQDQFKLGYYNEWEENFIDSLEGNSETYILSEKQNSILVRIHSQATELRE